MRSLASLAVTLGLVLSARVADAMRALRAELGDRAPVVRRASLGQALAECDAGEAECAERILRALGGARILHVRVDQTRGRCVPNMRGGQRVGFRMPLVTQVTAGRRTSGSDGSAQRARFDRVRGLP